MHHNMTHHASIFSCAECTLHYRSDSVRVSADDVLDHGEISQQHSNQKSMGSIKFGCAL